MTLNFKNSMKIILVVIVGIVVLKIVFSKFYVPGVSELIHTV